MKIIRTIFVAVALFLAMPNISLAGSQTFTSSGTFTVPVGVATVSVSMSGGGGSGSGVAVAGSPSSFGNLLTVNGGGVGFALMGGLAGGPGGTNGANGVICGGAANCPGVGGNSLFGTGGDALSGLNKVYYTNSQGYTFYGSPGQGYGSGGSCWMGGLGNNGYGGGGGAGAVNSQQLMVVPNESYAVTVGVGGGSTVSNGACAGAPGFVSVSWTDPVVGTVNVSSNISSSWTITGPATITGSGTSQSSPSQPTGTYTITWNSVSGYNTPATQTLTLDPMGTISFSGTYAATACTTATNSNCSLPGPTTSGSSVDGSCSAGYSGACNYTCSNSVWTQNSNSCTPSACTATTISNCALPATASESSAGACSTSYSGACNYLCTSGTWSATSNFCTPFIPDLTAAGTTATPASGTTGQSESFSGAISNIGTGAALNFPNMFQIKNSDLSADIALIDANTVASLAAGAGTNVSGSYTFASAGTYNIRVCANLNTAWGGSVTESNANNNCGSYQPLTVSWSACANGANNSPTCNTCSNPLFWNGSSCVACTGGCTGGTCNNGANNPSACSTCTAPKIMVGGICTSPAPCTTPWGTTVASGVSVQAFQVSSVMSPAACPASETRTCNNGTLSGSYTNSNCVVLQPIATISANPTRVRSTPPGNTSTISWTLSNTSCTATRNGVSWNPGPSFSSTNSYLDTITSQTTYTITCTDTATPQSVTVNVLGSFQEF